MVAKYFIKYIFTCCRILLKQHSVLYMDIDVPKVDKTCIGIVQRIHVYCTMAAVIRASRCDVRIRHDVIRTPRCKNTSGLLIHNLNLNLSPNQITNVKGQSSPNGHSREKSKIG